MLSPRRFSLLCALLLALASSRPADAGDGGLLHNQASPHARHHTVDLTSVHWTGGFWSGRFAQTAEVSLPRLWDLAGPWAWHNLRVAAGLEQGEFKGLDWSDEWIYKWIESACYVYSQNGDTRLLARIEEIIPVIAAAQQPDGYIATQITLRGLPRFEYNHRHELYTMGHLLTAASVHYRITGRDSLLRLACRAADYIHSVYCAPDADPMLANCPINPSIVMGAVDLYRATAEPRYLELANTIIDNRGKPRGPQKRDARGIPYGGTDNNQDRIPLREATEVAGHAVFWSYLYAGAADVIMETGDPTLRRALEVLWGDLVSSKMHVTGGVSPIQKGLSSWSTGPKQRWIGDHIVVEASGLPYELPNARAYNETCGQIGNLMWNWRMLCLQPEPRFAEIMERTLYNSILCGIEVDGDGWSYTNPLRWHGHDHELFRNDLRQRSNPGARQICCPTNLLRTTASFQGYLYTTAGDSLWVHHYGANRAQLALPGGTSLQLLMTTDYPWDGRIALQIEEIAGPAEFSLHLRIPEWAHGASLSLNGRTVTPSPTPSSYLECRRTWSPGDRLELNLPMPVRLLTANPQVEEAFGQVAVARGPIIYCLESTDLPPGTRVAEIRLPRQAQWSARHEPGLLGGVTVLATEALAEPTLPLAGPLFAELPDDPPRPVPIRMIPYFAWNNRGEPEMQVWIPLR